jgi:hypothetical protein
MTIKNCWTDDKVLHNVFCWLARIGAGPKFGTRPIVWYQTQMCNAIAYLESTGAVEFRCKNGMIQHKGASRRWTNFMTAKALYGKTI